MRTVCQVCCLRQLQTHPSACGTAPGVFMLRQEGPGLCTGGWQWPLADLLLLSPVGLKEAPLCSVTLHTQVCREAANACSGR